LVLPGERKSVEPMAARLAPDKVRRMHQSLHHLVADAPWSDEAILEQVRGYGLSAMKAKGPVQAWIVDDTGCSRKALIRWAWHDSTAGKWASRKTAGWR
jgi:SRSO17 transposase